MQIDPKNKDQKTPNPKQPPSDKENGNSQTVNNSKSTAKENRHNSPKGVHPKQAHPVPENDTPVEKELIINSSPTKVDIALLEDGKLVELHDQKTNDNFTVGDIFLGRIKRLMPGLNAAFVDIGHKKDAFLHYTDLGPTLNSLAKYTNEAVSGKQTISRLENFKMAPDIIKTGKVDQVLKRRQQLLVQILKEPISTKGPRLSCEITIPGRYLVLTPFSDVIAVSKKITSSEERARLKRLIESIRPKHFGVIVRTAAEGKKVMDLHEEMTVMLQKWEDIFEQLKGAKAPVKLLSELDKTSSILRDLLTDTFTKIVVNDRQMAANIRNFLSTISPEQVNIVQHHRGNKPIFEAYGVSRQIKSSFGKTATMSSGAYLVIEHTEAMHVIDVNSGHKMGSKRGENAVLNVNLEAAEEIARQLRLRDIGGIIIVDFIDMKKAEHRKELMTVMRQAMRKDRAQHTILPLSKFGLMQITRQRVRPEVKIDTSEVCPTCGGTGKMNASILLVDDIERDLDYIFQSQPKAKLKLAVHPYIEAYLKKGLPNRQVKWYTKYLRWVTIKADTDYALTKYRFFDKNDDEIRLNQ